MSEIDVKEIVKDPIVYGNKISIKELENLIVLLKDYYYNQDNPLVSDIVYDQLEDVLRKRNPKSKVLSLIGASVKEAVTLPFPMPSLNKAKAGMNMLSKWIEKYKGPYVITQKLDGISIMYYYKKGNSPQLFTRGNGIEGQNITGILKYIDIGKVKIPTDEDLVVVRGELMMSKKTWDKYYGKDNPNVRNFVSGLANAKHPNVTDLRKVELVAYQLMKPIMKPSEQFELLNEWGFNVVNYNEISTITEEKLLNELEKARNKGQYQVDGLVIAQDDVYSLTTDNPKHSIAFKSSDEVLQTKVIKVEWKASKRSLLIPVVIIEPVFLSGATISNVSGFNAKYIVDNSIGPGAIITVVRSGEVIPYIVSIDKQAKEPDLPEVEYEWDDTKTNIKLVEMNDEVHHSVLVHMTRTLKIENLGPGTLLKVIELGFRTPAEVLNMTEEDWKSIPSLGKNADKIWINIQKLETKGVKLSQLMDASNLFGHGIGQRKMQSVLDAVPNLLDLVDKMELIDLMDKLVGIKGVEIITAEKIVLGLSDFKKFLDEVPQIRILDEDDDTNGSSNGEINEKLKDLRVVFTGIRDKELETLIVNSGGTVADTVSKTIKNQVVVAKDPNANSNKLKTAKDLDLKIYSIQTFKKAYNID